MGSITAGKHFCGSLPFYGWGELAARDRGCERVHGSRDRRFVVYGRPKARGRGKGAPLPRLAADPSLRAGDGRWFAVKREIDYVVPVTRGERFGVSGGKLRSMNPLRSYWKSLATLAVVILPACAGAAR